MKTRFTYADDDSDDSTLQEVVRYARKPRGYNNAKRKVMQPLNETNIDPTEKETLTNVLKWMNKSRFSNPPTPELLAPPTQLECVIEMESPVNAYPTNSMNTSQYRQSRILPMTPMYDPSNYYESSKMMTQPNSMQHEFQRKVVDRLSNSYNPQVTNQRGNFDIHNDEKNHGTKMVYLYDSKNNHVYAEYGSFEHYYHIANGRIGEEPKYDERCCDNYYSNGQHACNSYSSCQYKHNQKHKMRRRVSMNNGYGKRVVYSDKKCRNGQRRKNSSSFDSSRCEKRRFKPKKKLSTVRKMSSTETKTINSLDQQKSQEIADRFSRLYWNVTERRCSGPNLSQDNFHTRYFGRAGHSVLNMKSSSNETQEYTPDESLKKQSNSTVENGDQRDRLQRARAAFKSGQGNKKIDDCYDLQGPSNRSAYKSHCEFYDLRVHNKVIPTVLPDNIRDDYWKTPKKYHHKFHDIF